MDCREGKVSTSKLFTPRFAPAALSSEGTKHQSKSDKKQERRKKTVLDGNLWSKTLSVFKGLCVLFLFLDTFGRCKDDSRVAWDMESVQKQEKRQNPLNTTGEGD